MAMIVLFREINGEWTRIRSFTSESEAQAYYATLERGHYLSETSFMYMDDTIETEFYIK